MPIADGLFLLFVVGMFMAMSIVVSPGYAWHVHQASSFDIETVIPLGVAVQALKNSGMSSMEIIVAAAQNSAYLCGVSDQLGTVEPGKIADLLVVSSDPSKI